MIDKTKPGKKSVHLQPSARPSRIRRDPVHVAQEAREAKIAWWKSDEWEARLAIFGIIAFAVAIFIIIIGASDFTN